MAMALDAVVTTWWPSSFCGGSNAVDCLPLQHQPLLSSAGGPRSARPGPPADDNPRLDAEWLLPVDRWNDVVNGNASSSSSPVVVGNETTTPLDVGDYLATRLGFRHRSLGESVALTVVYCIVMLTGVVGNVATCAVIMRNTYMHTATNCYLFSLAISDTLALVLGQSLSLQCTSVCCMHGRGVIIIAEVIKLAMTDN